MLFDYPSTGVKKIKHKRVGEVLAMLIVFSAGAIIFVVFSVYVAFIVRDMITYSNGQRVTGTVVGYEKRRETDSSTGYYLYHLIFEYVGTDNVLHRQVVSDYNFTTEGEAITKKGIQVQFFISPENRIVVKNKKPYLSPIIIIILGAAMAVMILGAVKFFRDAWYIKDVFVYRHGKKYHGQVLGTDVPFSEKTKWYKVKVECCISSETKILWTSKKFSEGEARYLLTWSDYDTAVMVKGKSIVVGFERDKVLMQETEKAHENEFLTNAGRYPLYREKEEKSRFIKNLRKELTTENQRQINGCFVIPKGKIMTGVEVKDITYNFLNEQGKRKYVGRPITLVHYPHHDNWISVEVYLDNKKDYDSCLNYFVAKQLWEKYGDGFILHGKIAKHFQDEGVMKCEITVPVFE